MKIFTKICLLLAVICISVGAVCMGVGVALGSGIKEVWAMAENGELTINGMFRNWYIPYLDDDGRLSERINGAVKEHFSADNVNNIEIDIKYGSVNLTDSKTDRIEITVNAPKDNIYTCDLENDTLVLLDQTPSRIWKAGLGRNSAVEVVIAIPKGKVFDEVSLATNAGYMEVMHSLSASEIDVVLDAGEMIAENMTSEKELAIDVGAGNLEIREFEAESLNIECGLGRAELYGSIAKDADVDCGMGEIALSLTGREDDYNYDISCGLGAVSINGEIYSTLSTDKEIDNNAPKEIDLSCGVGEITLRIEEE